MKKNKKFCWKEAGCNAAAAAHTGCDLAAQTDAELPRSTNPPNTSAWTSDCYTRVIVRQNGVGGYRLIGKSEACQEICCPELPSAPDSPSNHQSWVKKKTPAFNSLKHQVSTRHESVPKVLALLAVMAETTFWHSSNDTVFFYIFCWHLNLI